MWSTEQMLETNAVLQKIYLDENVIDEQIQQQSILPRLKYYRYRPLFVAIRKAPGLLPPKLLGLALGMVAKDTNLVFKLLGDCLGDLCAEEENNHGCRRNRKALELE
jgi:hypothetical protein